MAGVQVYPIVSSDGIMEKEKKETYLHTTINRKIY